MENTHQDDATNNTAYDIETGQNIQFRTLTAGANVTIIDDPASGLVTLTAGEWDGKPEQKVRHCYE